MKLRVRGWPRAADLPHRRTLRRRVRQLQVDVAGWLKEITGALGIPFIFKVELRQGQPLSSGTSFHWPGITRGPRSWPGEAPDRRAGATDVHGRGGDRRRGGVSRLLQTPAFPCRQTDHPRRGAIKAGEHQEGRTLAPHDMKNVIDKARAAAREKGLPTTCSWPASAVRASATTTLSRTCARSRSCARPARRWSSTTHSVQLPGGQGARRAAASAVRAVLARAAVAVGVAGLFMETHPDPANAEPTGPTRCR